MDQDQPGALAVRQSQLNPLAGAGMPGVAGLDQEGRGALVADPDALVGRLVGQAGLTQDGVQVGVIVGWLSMISACASSRRLVWA